MLISWVRCNARAESASRISWVFNLVFYYNFHFHLVFIWLESETSDVLLLSHVSTNASNHRESLTLQERIPWLLEPFGGGEKSVSVTTGCMNPLAAEWRPLASRCPQTSSPTRLLLWVRCWKRRHCECEGSTVRSTPPLLLLDRSRECPQTRRC